MLSVQKYEQALSQLLKPTIELLTKVYEIELILDTYELAFKFKYRVAGGTNLQIGLTDRKILEILNIGPELLEYNPSIIEGGYFIGIHRSYGTHWDMEPNLRQALENLGHFKVKPNEDSNIVLLSAESSREHYMICKCKM